MIALVLAASFQDLSQTLDRTPFKAEYTAWREGLDAKVKVVIQYSPPNMARLTWHSPEGQIGVGTDGEYFYTTFPGGTSSLSMREMAAWIEEVERRLAPRLKSLAAACGRDYEEKPLGEPGMRIEVTLARSGNEEKPFHLGGRISLGWNQARFAWLEEPQGARVEEADDALRIVRGDHVMVLDADTGILRSISIVDSGGRKLAAIDRVSLEKGTNFPRGEFSPASPEDGSQPAWRAMCASLLTGFVLAKAKALLPEDDSEWQDDARRALDEFFSSAADEVLDKFFGADAVEFIALAYAQVRAPREKILRHARVAMEMQFRDALEKGDAPEGPQGALLAAWRKALRGRLEDKIVKPVLKRLEELLSKGETPWR